jgi:hypothetical protein
LPCREQEKQPEGNSRGGNDVETSLSQKGPAKIEQLRGSHKTNQAESCDRYADHHHRHV